MPTKIVSTTAQMTEKALAVIFYFLVFVTPLISFRGVNELFEFPKMAFVYVVAGLIVVLFLWARVWPENFSLRKTSFDVPVVLFLGANLVSFLLSQAKYTSFFGYYTRFNGGLLSVFIFSLLLFIFTNIKNIASEKVKILEAALLASVPVSLYGIAQRMGYESGYWREDSQSRVFSSLGQPNWLAAYLLLTLLPALYLSLTSKERNYKIKYAAIVLLNFSAFWFTYSFSGFLGLGAALVFFFLFTGRKLLLSNGKFLGIMAGIAFLLMVTNPGVLKPKLIDAINDVRKNISSEFVAYAYDGDETQTGTTQLEQAKNVFGDTTAIRLIVWRGTLDLITSSPKNFLIGTGPETFPYAFLKFRPEELNRTSEWDFIFNKPHNFYLELLSNLGVLGLGTHLYLLYKIFRNPRQEETVGIKAGLLGLFVSDMFGWHTVTASLLLFLYIGYIAVAEIKDDKRRR